MKRIIGNKREPGSSHGWLSVNVNVSVWQIAVPLLILWFLIIFKEPLGKKIGDINAIKQGATVMEFRDPNRRPALERSDPIPGEPTMTVQEMLAIYAKTGYPTNAVAGKQVLAMLYENGITTKTQLQKMVDDVDIMRTLSQLYASVLGRPIEKPLDPMAIAQWGSIFFRYGISEGTIRGVKSALMVSAEYEKTHPR